jgi:hypothetical protein
VVVKVVDVLLKVAIVLHVTATDLHEIVMGTVALRNLDDRQPKNKVQS